MATAFSIETSYAAGRRDGLTNVFGRLQDRLQALKRGPVCLQREWFVHRSVVVVLLCLVVRRVQAL